LDPFQLLKTCIRSSGLFNASFEYKIRANGSRPLRNRKLGQNEQNVLQFGDTVEWRRQPMEAIVTP